MLKNLITGAKLAFFFKVSAKDFRISAGNLCGIFLLTALAVCTIDYYAVFHPARFSPYGFFPVTFFFCLRLFTGFLLSLLFVAPEFCLSIPIIVINAGFIPYVLGAVLIQIVRPGWVANHMQFWHFHVLFYLWVFLIYFRVLLLFTGTKFWHQLTGALLLLAALALPQRFLFFSHFWYTVTPPKQAEETHEPAAYAEDILQQQNELLDDQLDAIAPRTKGRNNYVVMFAGDGEQTVFMKEVLSGRAILEDKYHAKGHSIALINHMQTLPNYPLATVANLKNTLNYLGQQADPKEDMLILYLTSHGSKDATVEVAMNEDIWLRQLNGPVLKKLLNDSGFKWKVVIISACYSGSFIDALKDDSTIVMTSARKDRTSFGCGNEFDMTYFGDALFKQALPKTTDFVSAFNIAKAYIEKREKDENIEPRSEPQIYSGMAIQHYLHPEMPVYGPEMPAHRRQFR